MKKRPAGDVDVDALAPTPAMACRPPKISSSAGDFFMEGSRSSYHRPATALQATRCDVMAKIAWSKFVHLHPVAHLVIGVGAEGETMLESARPEFDQLVRLLAKMANGEYALTINRQSHALEIHCAFEREEDARKFGEALGAYQCVSYPTGASQRWFKLDAAAFDTARDASDVPNR